MTSFKEYHEKYKVEVKKAEEQQALCLYGLAAKSFSLASQYRRLSINSEVEEEDLGLKESDWCLNKSVECERNIKFSNEEENEKWTQFKMEIPYEPSLIIPTSITSSTETEQAEIPLIDPSLISSITTSTKFTF